MLALLRSHAVRRMVSGLSVVALAMTLSLALIITTPSTAQALTPKLPVAPTFVMGAVKTVAPVAMAAVSFTPVGWALRLGQLAFLAYSTSDIWMPFVTGAFGQLAPDADAGSTYKTRVGFRIGSPFAPPANPHRISWTITGITGSAALTSTVATNVKCKNNSTGVVSPGSTAADTVSLQNGDAGVVRSLTVCPVGSTVDGATLGPRLLPNDQPPGPENILNFGNVGGGFDPHGNDVLYSGKSECIDSNGTISWITGPQIPGDNGAMLMPSCEKAGKGHGTGRTKVEAFKPDGTTETVWDTGAQPLSDPATPLCDPGRATSGCTLDVLKDDLPCKSGDVECENWSEEQPKDPTRWKCKLGPYTMPMSACNLLEKAFVPGGSPLNDPNTDGNPSTASPLGPDGAPAPAPAPTVTGTGVSPVPGGAGQTGPGADQESQQCFPSGWAMMNPVEWVMKPVGCALRAAFIPSPTVVQTRTAAIQAKFTNVGFARITTAWMTTFEAAGGGSGCSGPTVNFEMSGVQQTLQPFNACTAPMSTVAGVSYAVSAIAMVLFGGLGIARAIAAGFGFNFSMGKGSDI